MRFVTYCAVLTYYTAYYTVIYIYFCEIGFSYEAGIKRKCLRVFSDYYVYMYPFPNSTS